MTLLPTHEQTVATVNWVKAPVGEAPHAANSRLPELPEDRTKNGRVRAVVHNGSVDTVRSGDAVRQTAKTMFQALVVWLRRVRAQPKPIIFATVLTVLSGLWWTLFSVGAFAGLGMPFFQTVGLPMQIGVISMGIFLTGRLLRNRPESAIRSVPTAVRIAVPLAVALGVLQLSQMPGSFPAKSPAGNPVRSFDAGVENGVCTALYNGSERVTESIGYCASYQS